MDRQNVDALVLLATGNVQYATGIDAPRSDSSRAYNDRPVALVVRGERKPWIVEPPVFPDFDDSAAVLANHVRERVDTAARIGVDEFTWAMKQAFGPAFGVVPAAAVLGPAKLSKTVDELACIRAAQRINEQAMLDVYPMVRDGVRQTDLSAAFLRRSYELGADTHGIDPVWQVMPMSLAEGPWTVHGHLAFPTASTTRALRDGDVIWCDTSLQVDGYGSDFGRTWIVGAETRTPTARQRAQYERWHDVVDATLDRVKPGVSSLELAHAAIEANGGVKPWLHHFYLSHAVGTDSAEMPMIGTDLGAAFDEQQILQAGMVLVLEPVIWDDGYGGYRAEDIFAVTDDGWVALSDHTYAPFED